jgi:hypothetical protein
MLLQDKSMRNDVIVTAGNILLSKEALLELAALDLVPDTPPRAWRGASRICVASRLVYRGRI